MAVHWRTVVSRLASAVWFRAVLFTVGAVAVVALAWWLGPTLDDAVDVEFGQDSVSQILQILATSMLAVTTFSLTAMISAYAAAAQSTTPRATQLLVEDPTSQNALSTFLGAFVFAVVGIIALATDIFGDGARTILFIATLTVVVIVVITLLGWIHHLTEFGRVPDILDRVEAAATATACDYARRPRLGGQPAVVVPEHAVRIVASRPGCLTGVALDELNSWARRVDAHVHLAVLPGVTVGAAEVVAWVESSATLTNDELATVSRAFLVEPHRTYEQDPRLGLVALAEIASRALSPSTNDPGTAIEALNAMERVFTRVMETEPESGVRYDRLYVPELAFDDLVEDGFRPIARDGAALVEVGLRLQRVVAHLMVRATAQEQEVLAGASQRAQARALAALTDPGDQRLVTEAAERARASALTLPEDDR
ncbi:DUF2254 domain-containing protein [Demequina sp. B12]|uniref:DUF2254 domain-containing protein n=1 Tax=Demequina sp. B12 TaxID=2992757 RepID=UPI00237A83EE|nr:DUF2254 domain-containing protein [Demequina sp. B12]MDE0573483.1 DUF2254 domain-containing protein [Demequina sp. B12]